MIRKLIRTRAHIALIAANTIYGINYAVAKSVMPDQIKPLALVSIRSFVTAILFWITGLFLPSEKVNAWDLLYIFGCSFFGVVINQIFFLTGLNLTSPINASILVSTNPIYAFIFAALILREKITFLKGSGLALGLTGVLILILHNGTPKVGSSTFIGDVITLINTISWALYTVIIKKMLEKYHPVTVMKWIFLFGSFTNIPVGYREWISMNWSFVTIKGYLEIGFVVIFATYLGYLLMSFGLRRLSPTIVSIYTYTQPVVAAYLASILGQDHVNVVMVISALLIFLGVFVVSKQKNEEIPQFVTGT
jgi:drug/metabolite transporter (DMT)-like permease